MKFKRLKNGILLVLALSLVMRSSCVLALEQSVSRETKSENDLFLYAKNVLEKYILLDEDACKEQKEYGISNGYKIENIDDPNYRIYFVFESNQCVGQIEVSYVKDEFVSSYTHKKESSITNAYVEHMPISLYCIDDDIWVITESECSPMWANGILDLEVESEFSKTEIVVTDI